MAQVADSQLLAGQYAQAAQTYRLLASADESQRHLYATIASLLEETEGVYVVTEPYPSEARLLGRRPLVPIGPALLRDPDVLAAALRDKAGELARNAAERISLGTDALSSDAPLAAAQARAARRTLDQADQLCPGLADSYRGDLAALGLRAHWAMAHEHAAEFDRQLGFAAPVSHVEADRLRRALAAAEADLVAALQFVPDPTADLAGEARQAREDLATIRELKSVLHRHGGIQ